MTERPGVRYNRGASFGAALQSLPHTMPSYSKEHVIPFPATARSAGESEVPPRRRREAHDLDRPTPARRSPRRRRQHTSWLQRNALSVVAVSMLVAVLGLGFGLLQMINRAEPATPAMLAVGQADASGTTLVAASTGPAVQLGALVGSSSTGEALAAPQRSIAASAKVLEPNYTVAAGDTLGQIAARFNTSVERIQSLNGLTDPRALRIGTRLVIPPPF